MTPPTLDLPEGISVRPDDDEGYLIEVWRTLPGDGTYFERLGYIETFGGSVHVDGQRGPAHASVAPQADVDWILRRAPEPRDASGRACGGAPVR